MRIPLSATLLLPLFLPSLTGSCSSSRDSRNPGVSSPVVSEWRDEDWWRQRHAETRALADSIDASMVFIGDSITQSWEEEGLPIWRQYYHVRNAVNLGISGDRTQHVLWRLQNGALDGCAPRVAVLMIGTNNSADDPPEEIAAGVEKIVSLLRALRPQMRILLLGVFPRGPDSNDPSRIVNGVVNQRISELDDGEWVSYLEIGSAFLEIDGTLSPRIMPDMLHLSEEGYGIWAKSMEPTLVALLRR